MIDEFVSTIVNSLISQGGGWLIAVLLGIIVYVMDKRLTEAKQKTEHDLRSQYEQRLTEFRELLDVIGASTQSIHSMQTSVVATGEATNQLTQAFAKLLREMEGQKTARGANSRSVTKQLDDIKRRIETMQKGHAA